MKFQFKIQDYQTDAVESTLRVFAGQPNQAMGEYIIDKGKLMKRINGGLHEVADLGMEERGYRNQPIALSDDELLHNLHSVQADNNVNLSSGLSNKLGRCALDIEMETGTGKTYVYIKTMFEMNKRFGWSKFIVVVPSIAIREGVKKSFDITVDHFMELYGKKARYFVYNSKNLGEIETFSSCADISVMIINTQAFNTSFKDGAKNEAARIIFSKRDEFGSRRPIDVIAANNPIVIMDEPQKMGGTATQTSLQKFNPLFTLNYSATHKDVHNPVYVLDALDAFQKKLVKKIEVIGFELKNIKGTDGYLYLESIILSKDKAPQARIEYEVQLASGNIKRQTRTFSAGDDLYALSNNLNQYKGIRIAEILPTQDKIVFSNGEELHINEATGNISEKQKIRIQIRETIKAHFRKERSNFKKGIKTLSLFFLDEVANYRLYDEDNNQLLGEYGKIFEDEYRNILNENLELYDVEYNTYLAGIEPSRTHAGYFSIDGKGRAVNSEVKRGETFSDDISAYDLILKDKERLLSFEEPVRFIFSHSALREGWDNPNVFQICSLRQSNSATQKRQEVGRGLRLCVNSHGVRQDLDTLGEASVHSVNKLTVIASEGYATFVDALQDQIKQDLYERPQKADMDFFINRKVRVGEEVHTITKDEAQDIYFQLRAQGYINKTGEVQEPFRQDLAKGSLVKLSDDLEPLTDAVYRLVQSIFDPSVLRGMIENGSRAKVKNTLNDNAQRAEWIALWNRINHKYAYMVSFNSDELINKSVYAIDAHLQVSQLTYVVTTGAQDSVQTFATESTTTQVLRTDSVTSVKYDLIGQLAKETTLTRRTIATILTRIRPHVFNMYKANPEEFIAKCAKLIKEQKAAMIVDHITYNQIEGEYDSNIFIEEKWEDDYKRAFNAKKSIQDYVFTDGYAADGQSVERKFAEALDAASEVVVYAKLPRGFQIPTPVGNYAPDWAVAFREGTVKHIYFVAETKGTMSSLELKPIEQTKIHCATRLYDLLSDHEVLYRQVSDYDTLLNMARN
ncbi:MAG: DEAD/DEAH box helicase family protein [Paludibacteraceae bacterium]|nr:DEAD/DEAH box helicase family protein [Paludibacteraceae bacterium]MBR1556415.1 DEAD/DEAH box helicase family protein [Prevotella sp.]